MMDLNGKTDNLWADVPAGLKVKVNGMAPVALSGVETVPALGGCLFNLPLYHPLCSGASFLSVGGLGMACVVTGTQWTPLGRAFDGSGDMLTMASYAYNYRRMTFEAWVKPATLSSRLSLLGNNDTAGLPHLEVGSFGGTARFTCLISGGVKAQSGNGALVVGIWSHLVYVHGPDSAHALYVNGAEVALPTKLTSTYGSTAETPRIGARNGAPAQVFNGVIGEARLYSVALAASQVTNLFLATRWRYGR